MFHALGWLMVATWLYILAYVLAANQWPGARPYLDGALWRIFQGVSVVGFFLCPIWIVGAVVLTLFLALQKQWPTLADAAVFMLVICLMGGYYYLALQD